jgi:hypothetical protein
MMYLEASPSSLQGTGNVSYLVPVLPTRVCRYPLDFRFKARGEGSDDVSHAPDDLFASFSTWNTSTGTGSLLQVVPFHGNRDGCRCLEFLEDLPGAVLLLMRA